MRPPAQRALWLGEIAELKFPLPWRLPARSVSAKAGERGSLPAEQVLWQAGVRGK